MDQPSFNRFLSSIDDYAANREWDGFSDDSFVEDIVHMIGKALGYENNPNGYEASVNHIVQVLHRRAPQCFKTTKTEKAEDPVDTPYGKLTRDDEDWFFSPND